VKELKWQSIIKQADRVPIDLGAMRSTGIAIIAYNKLRKKLGITKGLASSPLHK